MRTHAQKALIENGVMTRITLALPSGAVRTVVGYDKEGSASSAVPT
jgi:hypothetical protein